MAVIGLDLGGTKLASAVFTRDGDVLEREVSPLDGRAGSAVGALIAERVRALRERHDGSIDAIGVAVPGIYRAARGTVWAPNVPGWDDYPLLDELCSSVGRKTLVVIDTTRSPSGGWRPPIS